MCKCETEDRDGKRPISRQTIRTPALILVVFTSFTKQLHGDSNCRELRLRNVA